MILIYLPPDEEFARVDDARSGGERLAWDLFSLSPPEPRPLAGDDSPRPEPACCVRPGLSPAQKVEVAAIRTAANAAAVLIGFACGWRW